ncbi:MAG: SpoIVB peptidase [Lachnospiraceae bacterium]|nr:SpoIVB peptidase [Lachnospiraceae bacterium]
MEEQVKPQGFRRRIYKKTLYFLLSAGIIAVFASLYYSMWSSVPSTIMLKAGMDQTLDFRVPASGELYREAIETSGSAGQNTSAQQSLHVDFGKTVVVKANQVDQYKLYLKLFGMIPLKEVDVEVIQDIRLKPAGIPIGIYVKTKGVLIVGIGEFEGEDGQTLSPGKYVFQTGDYILEINDQEINEKKELVEMIDHCEGQELYFTLQRGESILKIKARPEQNKSGEYKMGIWVRDNAQGVGTMTYIDENGCFGALGHGINDIDTGTLMSLAKGTLYHTEIIGITRGSTGAPGELTGFIEYDDKNIMGSITDNTAKGIFGICTPETEQSAVYDYLPLGLKQEIKKGEAQIICSLGGEAEIYDVEIVDINLENDNVNRGIVVKITDPELLAVTGGIVQGMSGSPIIQDGKLIGAVTHVLVQDPTKGYGIFIEEMLVH